MKKISPLAPGGFPDMPAVPGVSLAAGRCGLRYAGRPDVFLASFAPGTRAAGVLTKSRTAAAPVDWCRQALKSGEARALIVNAGNANAFTGLEGRKSVERTVEKAAAALSCSESHVFVASTGVIGETLPDERIRDSLEGLRDSLTPHGWKEAAEAMMTTDTFPKGSWRKTRVGGAGVVVCGIAKGSGMIAPDMATMLAFVFTDAAIGGGALRQLLSRGVDRSFNHRGRRHVDQRHGSAVRDGRGGARPGRRRLRVSASSVRPSTRSQGEFKNGAVIAKRCPRGGGSGARFASARRRRREEAKPPVGR